MLIKELIDELYLQEDLRLHHLAGLLGKVAERYKAGEVSDTDVEAQIKNVERLLEVYKIKDKVKHKALAQKIEDLLVVVVKKGVVALF